MKLTELEPRFIQRVSPVDFEHTDDIAAADGLQLHCPSCHWANQRSHTMILWREPGPWRFAGRGYDDLSMLAGRTLVNMSGGGPCRCSFHIRGGKVDFH